MNGDWAYLQCYSSPDQICLDSQPSTGSPVLLGEIIVPSSQAPLARDSAVVLPGDVDGAYMIQTSGLVIPATYVYCTGRGTFRSNLGGCQTDRCLHFTTNFVTTTGAPAQDGDQCYFNCFHGPVYVRAGGRAHRPATLDIGPYINFHWHAHTVLCMQQRSHRVIELAQAQSIDQGPAASWVDRVNRSIDISSSSHSSIVHAHIRRSLSTSVRAPGVRTFVSS